jgi:hypothetical protein
VVSGITLSSSVIDCWQASNQTKSDPGPVVLLNSTSNTYKAYGSELETAVGKWDIDTNNIELNLNELFESGASIRGRARRERNRGLRVLRAISPACSSPAGPTEARQRRTSHNLDKIGGRWLVSDFTPV